MTASTMNETATLEDWLSYRHPGVIRRYCKEHHASTQEGEEVFREMLKWLYLCSRSLAGGPDGIPCAITPEIEKIDWMWHTFLLFTMDYADFCERYAGFFLHHFPTEGEEAEDGTALDEDEVRAELEQRYGFIYDVLGEETLTAWYDERRYSPGKEEPHTSPRR